MTTFAMLVALMLPLATSVQDSKVCRLKPFPFVVKHDGQCIVHDGQHFVRTNVLLNTSRTHVSWNFAQVADTWTDWTGDKMTMVATSAFMAAICATIVSATVNRWSAKCYIERLISNELPPGRMHPAIQPSNQPPHMGIVNLYFLYWWIPSVALCALMTVACTSTWSVQDFITAMLAGAIPCTYALHRALDVLLQREYERAVNQVHVANILKEKLEKEK